MSNRKLATRISNDRVHPCTQTDTRTGTRTRGRAGALATAALVGVTSLVGHVPTAHADEVSPTGKGIVGGALMGGEVVTIVMSFTSAKSIGAYAVGFGLGAAAGGVGGYFVEQSSTDGRVPMYMLAGGLGLLIPAIVLTLNATRYQPTADLTEDRAPTNVPPADPGTPGGTPLGAGGGQNTTPASMAPPAAGGSGTPSPDVPGPSPTPSAPAAPSGPAGPPVLPLSLLDVRGGELRLGLPVPEVRPMYSMSELKQMGLQQQTEFRMPLVKLTF
jgi:hypothetical protein